MLKRAFDLVFAILSLVLLAPLLLVLSLLVLFTMGRPVFFTQRRPGLHGELFRLYKFRSMHEAKADQRSDRERVSRVGAFLRATSLDELPELWNIAKGEMSFVGPRPLLEEYLPKYSERQARRHEVKPGLTGWAQVNGRNSVDWPTRLEMDVWYVENQSFLLDLKILALTVIRVVSRDGVNESDETTMTRFGDET